MCLGAPVEIGASDQWRWSLFVCLLACLLVCLFACLLVCLFACLPVCLFACLLVCFSVCLFVCLSACLFVCLFVGCLLVGWLVGLVGWFITFYWWFFRISSFEVAFLSLLPSRFVFRFFFPPVPCGGKKTSNNRYGITVICEIVAYICIVGKHVHGTMIVSVMNVYRYTMSKLNLIWQCMWSLVCRAMGPPQSDREYFQSFGSSNLWVFRIKDQKHQLLHFWICSGVVVLHVPFSRDRPGSKSCEVNTAPKI